MGFLNRIFGRRAADGDASEALKQVSEVADRIRRGLEHHQAGDLQSAESAYREALDLAPDHPDGHYLLGSLLGESGRLDEALEHLEQAARLDPSAAAARSDIGNVYRAQGRLEEAESAYRGAIAIDAEFSNAHRNLGDLLHFQGRVDQAIDCFAKAASLAADDAPGLPILAAPFGEEPLSRKQHSVASRFAAFGEIRRPCRIPGQLDSRLQPVAIQYPGQAFGSDLPSDRLLSR